MSASSMPNRRRLRRGALAAALALLVGPLAACAAIPGSGPVREGLPNLDQQERGVLFNPPGPQPGASPEDIVRGFVRAASSSAGDYETARDFLAPSYATSWNPGESVLIEDGAQQLEIDENDVAKLSLKVVASLDSVGKMVAEAPDDVTELRYELTEVGGEWRIKSAPTGIVLNRDTFKQVWTARQLFFLSGDDRLVPDTRWFLNNQATLSTQVVRALLNGPSEPMSGVLRTAFPAGTELLSNAVPVADGTATIDLSADLFNADEATMDLLKQQLAASLRPVQSVSRFRLMVQGTVVEQAPTTSAEEVPGSDHQIVSVLKEGHFGTLSGGEVRPYPGLGERVVELDPIAVTMAPDRSSAAVLHRRGVSWVDAERTVQLSERPGLLPPSLDLFGYVWMYDPAQPGEVTVERQDGQPVSIALPWLEGEEVKALRVSMGGNRLAALVERDGQSVVLVAGIGRDRAGAPGSVTETAPAQLWVQGAPIDLDWYGETRFAVVNESGLLGNTRRVVVGRVGDFSSEEGTVAGGESISGGGGGSRETLRVLDNQHRLYTPAQRTQGEWQTQQGEVQLLAKVG